LATSGDAGGVAGLFGCVDCELWLDAFCGGFSDEHPAIMRAITIKMYITFLMPIVIPILSIVR